MVGLRYQRKLRGTREASNGGRVRVRIIHGLNINHKELTYLLQKSISHRKKHYAHARHTSSRSREYPIVTTYKFMKIILSVGNNP